MNRTGRDKSKNKEKTGLKFKDNILELRGHVSTDGLMNYGDCSALCLIQGTKVIKPIYYLIYGQYLKGASTDHMIELGQKDKERIFNLGYYTWVEQQGIHLDDFENHSRKNNEN